MIIVSQSKEEIINFENVAVFTILKNKHENAIRANYETGKLTTIGIYKTEEKAKEVLQKIVDQYCSCNSGMGYEGYVKNKVYYMPEE